jgi:hypothetical protein
MTSLHHDGFPAQDAQLSLKEAGVAMSGKNKGGREARKPKQDKNKKAQGQTPPPGGVAAAVQPPVRTGRH